jgi:hypothetical protein
LRTSDETWQDKKGRDDAEQVVRGFSFGHNSFHWFSGIIGGRFGVTGRAVI